MENTLRVLELEGDILELKCEFEWTDSPRSKIDITNDYVAKRSTVY